MFFGLFDDNKRYVKELSKIADKVIALEDEYKLKTDGELREQTKTLKEAYANGEKLDALLPRAFATVREASGRVLNMRHFKVQIMGGIALHQGRISEMRTGEGKTLVSTLPAYLNALTGKGVHIVTVNDYLAERDSVWMGKIHKFLGLTVGVSLQGHKDDIKRKAYACDITYATNNEIGFDYLRDNICQRKEQRVLRGLNFAIVDEVDSILIDEARTPLIISGHGAKSSDNYIHADRFVKTLKADDIDIDKEKKQVRLSDNGVEKAEKHYKIENLGDANNLELNHYINNALKANIIMHLDQDYIIKNEEVVIIDENTGRIMDGRRYSDGLHQAIEAKEGVEIRAENQTMATVTFQNLFRMYKKLSGMTGTAKTEEGEFNRIYNLDVVQIPTNLPLKRIDENDVVYITEEGKYKAVLEDAKRTHEKGQPVLIGTVNIDKSELLSKLFRKEGIKHNVLNAKNHELEAEIVAQAGRLNAVTIATNMAGRGTDILLGGNPEFLAKQEMKKQGYSEELIESSNAYLQNRTKEEQEARDKYLSLYSKFRMITDQEKQKVIELGGLRIIGTERHESRRIDNQLRGRSGRQGDPGESIFYLSLNDDLIKRFGGQLLQRMAAGMNMGDEYPLRFKLLGWSIQNAQKRIEGANFTQRKYTLEYDDVMNKQRSLIYTERNKILDGKDVHEEILDMIFGLCERTVKNCISDDKLWSEWDYDKLNREIEAYCLKQGTNLITENSVEGMEVNDVVKLVGDAAIERYERQVAVVKNDGHDFGVIERHILLSIIDKKWIEHIDCMTILKNDIGLRGYGQRDPLVEYKKESIEMYDNMLNSIHDTIAKLVLNIEITKNGPQNPINNPQSSRVYGSAAELTKPIKPAAVTNQAGSVNNKNTQAKAEEKTDRNGPCPCGSGVKYKKCCGRNE